MNTAVMKERVIHIEQSHPRSMAWSPVLPEVLALGSRDGAVQILDLVHGIIQCTFTTLTPVHDMAWSPDGSYIGTPGAEHTVEIWTVATGAKRLRYYGHQAGVYRRVTEEIQALAWSPDGKWMVSASSGGTMQLWDASTGIHLKTLVTSSTPVSVLAWSPDTTSLMAAVDSTLQEWHILTGSCSVLMALPMSHITVLTWAPDGKHLLCGDEHGAVLVWDGSRGTPVVLEPPVEGAIKAATWRRDDVLHLAFVGPGGDIHLREIQP